MEMVTYYGIPKKQSREFQESVEYACSFLWRGQDLPDARTHLEWHRYGISLWFGFISEVVARKYNLDREELLKFVEYDKHAQHVLLTLSTEYDIKELIKLPEDIIHKIYDFYPVVVLVPFAKQGFEYLQLQAIESGLMQGLDPSFYANVKYKPFKMYEIQKMMADGIVSEKLFSELSPEQLQEIRNLYKRFGEKVIQLVEQDIEFYSNMEPENISILVRAKLFGFETRDMVNYRGWELRMKFLDAIKQKLRKVVAEEIANNPDCEDYKDFTKRYEMRIPDRLNWDMLEEIMELAYKGAKFIAIFGGLLQFRKESDYPVAKQCFEEAGISPDEFMRDILKEHNKTGEDRMVLHKYRNAVDSYLKAKLSDIVDTDKLNQLPTLHLIKLYDLRKHGIDITATKLLERNYSIEELDIIGKYLKRSVDLSQYVIPAQETGIEYVNKEAYNQIIDILGMWMERYQINVCRQIMNALTVLKKDEKQVLKTLQYITAVLHSGNMYVAQQLLDISVNKNMYFTPKQMGEIHLGILQGVDVSKYAKKGYNYNIMSIIREGLLQNVDLSIYTDDFDYAFTGEASDKPYVLKHILHMKTGIIDIGLLLKDSVAKKFMPQMIAQALAWMQTAEGRSLGVNNNQMQY